MLVGLTSKETNGGVATELVLGLSSKETNGGGPQL
jgi:hypothetical protein